MEKVSPANSLLPGADLWVTADLQHGRLTERLDWYMNFQITKAGHHTTQQISENLQTVLDHCGLQKFDFIGDSEQSLLIASQGHLPNRWVLVVPFSESWAARIHQAWKSLGSPSTRIFLPAKLSIEQFEKQWRKVSDFNDLTLVTEQV